jgi:acyl carrier protein
MKDQALGFSIANFDAEEDLAREPPLEPDLERTTEDRYTLPDRELEFLAKLAPYGILGAAGGACSTVRATRISASGPTRGFGSARQKSLSIDATGTGLYHGTSSEVDFVNNCDRLRKLVAEVLRVPEQLVTDAMTLLDTETWDSFAHLELIVAIESEFGVSLSADDIAAMTSFAAIRTTLISRGVEV